MAFRTANGFQKAGPPTVNDDISQGIEPGAVLVDTTNGQAYINLSNGLAAATWQASGSMPTETGELYIPPEIRTGGDSTRADQILFDGGSFLVSRYVTFNRIHLRVSSRAGAPTLRFLLFQAALGGSGIAARVATVELFAVPAGGTNAVLTPAEGNVTLSEGIVFCLWGRDSALGSFGLQTYAMQTTNLLTSVVPAGLHPLSFTTAIASNTTPATFDPRATTGQAIPGGSVDVVPIIRLQRV